MSVKILISRHKHHIILTYRIYMRVNFNCLKIDILYIYIYLAVSYYMAYLCIYISFNNCTTLHKYMHPGYCTLKAA